MGAKVGHPNFKGNSNSGRKSLYEEENKAKAINALWKKVNTKIENGEELTEQEEKWVIALLPKTIRTQTDITSAGKPVPIIQLQDVSANSGNEQNNSTEQED